MSKGAKVQLAIGLPIGIAIGIVLAKFDHVGFWLFGFPIASVLILSGPLGAKRFLAMMRTRIAEDPEGARSLIYRQIILSGVMMTAGCVFFLSAYGFERSDYGLTFDVGDNAGPLLVVFGSILGGIISVIARKRGGIKRLQDSSDVALMLPRTKSERRLWVLLSLTAGIGEEIAYRGFLTTYFYFLHPEMPLWGALALSSVVFGFAHLYQGRQGIALTTILGGFLAYLYWSTESLLLSMIVHTAIDLAALRHKVEEPEEATTSQP